MLPPKTPSEEIFLLSKCRVQSVFFSYLLTHASNVKMRSVLCFIFLNYVGQYCLVLVPHDIIFNVQWY